ncbi:uncharacterized protein G2W53_020888 [Senna tora]|uniref:Uncharacterized protein n=1 Tax=Senna tora TaxID=362788 RepID=A0A834TKF4_9FABA|nr:uncharacterized protein G2W53_020888 [Senna tora]
MVASRSGCGGDSMVVEVVRTANNEDRGGGSNNDKNQK